ncbi:putative histone-fold protein [Plasmopara halstedii]
MFKSRVKRLLKEQKDMGQVTEAAAVTCSSILKVFVRDIATKMQNHKVEGGGLTPVELKKSILASSELSFLHEKVVAIDENNAKYHKRARRSQKRNLKTTAKKSTTSAAKSLKKPRTLKTKKTTERETVLEQILGKGSIRDGVGGDDGSSARKCTLDIEEDENYDESDSDE